jgi:hypothetical protein
VITQRPSRGGRLREPGFPASDQSDGTHLNNAGSQKVAGWFLDVVLPWFKP